MKFHSAYLWPPSIMATLFFVSGQSHVAAPAVGVPLDKVAHFIVFGALATSIVRLPGLPESGWKAAGIAWTIAAGFGALDEFRQSFTPGRAVEWADWVADASGAAVAVILYTQCPLCRRLAEWPRSAPPGRGTPRAHEQTVH